MQHLEQIVEGMVEGVLVIDARGSVIQANRAAAKLTGRSRDQLVGTAVASLISVGHAMTIVVARDPETAERQLRALVATADERIERARGLERRLLCGAVARAAADADVLERVGRKLRALARPDPSRAVELNNVVTEIVGAVAATGRLRGSEIVFVLHDEPLFVSASRARIEQILAHLVCNAAEAFGRQPGKVLVATRLDGTRTRALVEVTDDGPGMAPDVVARATEPMFTTKADSLGLGLAVARELVEGYGGVLKLESVLGLGATATFDLPIARAA